MEDIRSVVRNETWQALRRSMVGTWKHTPAKNLRKLRVYLSNTHNSNKLRRVNNYLASLRGVHYPGIKQMRDSIKKKRIFLKQTTAS